MWKKARPNRLYAKLRKIRRLGDLAHTCTPDLRFQLTWNRSAAKIQGLESLVARRVDMIAKRLPPNNRVLRASVAE
jgi:hypothetical protein